MQLESGVSLSADRNSSTMTCVNGYVRLIHACLKCVHLGWVAVSASLVSCFSCLRSCLPSCLAFRRREPVRLLSDHLPDGWLLVEFWGGVHTWPNTQEWFRASVCFATLGKEKQKTKEGTASCFWWSHLKNPFLEALCLLLGQEACQNHWIVRAAGDAPHHTL